MKTLALVLALLLCIARMPAQNGGSTEGTGTAPVAAPDYRAPKIWEPRFALGISVSSIVVAAPLAQQRNEWKLMTTFRLSSRLMLKNGIATIYHSDDGNEIYFRRVIDEVRVEYLWRQIKKEKAMTRIYSGWGIKWQGDFYPDTPWRKQFVPWDDMFWMTPTWLGAEVILADAIGITLEANSVGTYGFGDFYPTIGVHAYLNR